jgi:hypothetical protein
MACYQRGPAACTNPAVAALGARKKSPSMPVKIGYQELARRSIEDVTNTPLSDIMGEVDDRPPYTLYKTSRCHGIPRIGIWLPPHMSIDLRGPWDPRE